MKVCIAEKPSVAREIAKIIGAQNRKDGYLEGNGYAVTWTFGHLCELCEPDDYQAHWKSWNLDNLPMLPERFETKLKGNKGVKQQFNVIKSLFKKASVVINCGDAGQEGELIQRWVMQQAKYKGPVQRLWISSLTPEAIKDGFQNLRPASDYDALYHAGSARAIGDWLLGMNATRLYTLKYGGYKQMLSVGRVQTPTLAMVVQRHHEIDSFVPEDYWELHTLYKEVNFLSEKGRMDKEQVGQVLLQAVEGQPFHIVSVEKKDAKERPPSLFDLTGLQVYCNKRFGYSADQTLKIAQKLYEQKIISYPRVDTTYLPNDIYPKIKGILQKMGQYTQFTQSLLSQKIRKSSKVFNDAKVTDHHAIIPTGYEKGLSGMEQCVYDSIARRFIAAFYPDCLVAKTEVIGQVFQYGNKEKPLKFKATGRQILAPGWREVLPSPQKGNISARGKSSPPEEQVMPAFQQGEQGPHQPVLQKKQTQPPKPYTEATLLRAMETAGKQVDDEELRQLMKANGIGRPSTRAAILETLFRRKYIQRQKKQLQATPVGIQLIGTIKNELLKSAELTGQWERRLKEIERGEYPAADFIGQMKKMVEKLVEEVRKDHAATRIQAAGMPKSRAAPLRKTAAQQGILDQSCPKCRKGRLLKGKAAYGCSAWKAGCDFRLPFEYLGKALTEKQLIRLVNTGATIILKGFEAKGKKMNGRLVFDKEYRVKLNPSFRSKTGKESSKPARKPSPTQPQCPKCGKGTILKGKSAYGCSEWKTGCDFRMSFEEVRTKAQGQELTKEVVLRILKG